MQKKAPSGYSKLAKSCVLSLQTILNKTYSILETSNNLNSTSNLQFSQRFPSHDQLSNLAVLTHESQALHSKILENLDILNDTYTVLRNNLSILDDEIRNIRASPNQKGPQQVFLDNHALLRANEDLQHEIQELRQNWSCELENARVQWSAGMDKMQVTYEKNIKDLTDAHENQVLTLTQSNKDKLKLAMETEKKLIDKLQSMNSDQANVLNKLNEKIEFLSIKSDEEAGFVEKVLRRIENIFEKFDLVRKEYCFVSLKDKVLFKIEELEMVFERNREAIVGCTRAEMRIKVKKMKDEVVASSDVVKKFEVARGKLLKHFDETPKGGQALTSRF